MNFEVWLDNPTGDRIVPVDKLISLDVVHVVNDYGVIALEIPSDYDSYLNLDGIIEVWYRGNLEAAGFVRKMRWYDDSSGTELTRLIAYTGNYLLTSRIVAYYSASANSTMTDYSDDMLKEIVTDNLLGDATGARDISSLNLSVEAQRGAGYSMTKSFAWRPLLTTFRDIAAASNAAGKKLYFDFVPKLVSLSTIGFEFKTWIGQRGNDHSSSSGDPVYFGKAWGNLTGPSYEVDNTEEENYIYAAGQGEEANRNVREISDATRVGASVWNRREGFADARNESTNAGVDAKGYKVLYDGLPKRAFGGEIIDSPAARYGTHWGFGDKVSVEYRGVIYDVLVNAVSIQLDSNGNESITGKLVDETGIIFGR